MSTTTTGKAIRQLLSTLMGGVVEIGAQVGSGASTTTIVDTGNYKGRAIPSSLYDNATLRMTSGSLAGQTTYVDYIDGATGAIHLDPPLGGTPADTDEFEIWLHGVDPDYVDRLRDDCLQYTCSAWRQNVMTVVVDGDLQGVSNGAVAGDVTHWNVVGSATRTKALAGAPDAKSRFLLSVVHPTATTDFVDTDAVECQPSEIYFVEVPVKAYVTATSAAATASLIPLDVTNTATIPFGSAIRTSHTGRGWGHLSFSFQIPAGCFQFKLRLSSDTAASTTTWGQLACHKINSAQITLPDRINSKGRVGRTFLTTQVTNSTQYVNNFQFKMREYKNVERNRVGSNIVLYFNPALAYWNACYYYERGYFPRLQTTYITPAQRAAGDSAVTDCAIEYVSAALAEKLSKRLLDKLGAEWQDDWVRASTMFNYWEGEFGPEPQHIFENEQPVTIPQVRV